MVDTRLGRTRHSGRGMATLPKNVHDVSADQATATHHKNSHSASSTLEPALCQDAAAAATARFGPEWHPEVIDHGRPGERAQAVLPEATWPTNTVPQLLHLDLTVESVEELLVQHERVLRLGGRQLYDRIDDPDEPLRVYADLAGHPFCVFVG
ncbi:VOC family protein [Micromonospora sp. 050-3]|uniref:VOC family protein n=1 Tax=Micromonospora sp. 050-3 TaxID=2789265 RepID=UPI0039793717